MCSHLVRTVNWPVSWGAALIRKMKHRWRSSSWWILLRAESRLGVPPLLYSAHALTRAPQGGTRGAAQYACLPRTSTGSKRVAGEAEMRSVGQFPKGSVPGLRHQWNCDLLSLLHASICSTPHPLPFKSCLSKHFSVSPPALSSSFTPFLFHILWVMYAFIPPNNFIHHPIRVGKLFITCPYRCKTERWEREREKDREWEGGSGKEKKWAEGQQGNRVNEMTLSFH